MGFKEDYAKEKEAYLKKQKEREKRKEQRGDEPSLLMTFATLVYMLPIFGIGLVVLIFAGYAIGYMLGFWG